MPVESPGSGQVDETEPAAQRPAPLVADVDTSRDQDPSETASGTGHGVTAGRIAVATRWMSIGQAITQGSRLVVSILLARWLAPEAFGVVAVAMTVVLALDILKDLGTGAAIIQRKTVDETLLSSVFVLNIITATVAGGGMVLTAPQIAWAFGTPEAESVVRALSAVLVVGGFTHVHHAMLRRTMNFAAVAKVDITGATVTGAVSIGLAIGGLGVWAIVWGNIAGFTAGSVMAWYVSRWRPVARPRMSALREIAGFSLHTAANGIFTFLRQNLDKVLVARWLGASSLGIYTLGQRTVSYPVLSLTNVLMAVLFPAFSRMQDDDEGLRRGYVRATGAIAFITLPLLSGTALIAEPFVHAVLGPQWDHLIPVLWLMAPAGAIQSVLSAVTTLYSAKGRADWLMRWGVASGIASLAAYALGLQWGLTGLAVAYLAINVILLPIGLAIPLRLIDMRLRTILRGLLPYAAMTAVMAIAVFAVLVAGAEQGWGPLARLSVGVATGLVVYGGLAVVVRPVAMNDVLTVLVRRGAR